MTPGDELRAEAARSDRAALLLRASIPPGVQVTEDERQARTEKLARHHDARGRLYSRCAEAADRCGS